MQFIFFRIFAELFNFEYFSELLGVTVGTYNAEKMFKFQIKIPEDSIQLHYTTVPVAVPTDTR